MGITFFMSCILGELFILTLNTIISIFFAYRRWKNSTKKPKSSLIPYYWERVDYIPKEDNPKPKKKRSEQQQQLNTKIRRYSDEYLERNLNFFQNKIMKTDNSKNVKIIDSEDESYSEMKQSEYQGGVGLTADLKVKFTRRVVRCWSEY